MRSTLRILLIGLLFYSGHGIPFSEDKEADYVADEKGSDGVTSSSAIIVSKPQVIALQQGDEVWLPCDVENNKGNEEVVLWVYNNFTHPYGSPSPLSADDDFLATYWATNLSVQKNRTLHIKNFNATFNGYYTCQLATNNAKTMISHAVGLREPLQIEYINAKKYIDTEGTLNITCRVRGFPLPTISWEKTGMENSIKRPLPDGENLVIESVTFNDSGNYVCKASNGDTQDSKSVSVTVISGIAPESSIVHAGEVENNTKICCVYDKEKKITWLKDDKQLSPSDRFFEEKEKHKECIIIKKVKEEDFGNYTCQSQKSTEEKAVIQLIGTPSKPILKTITKDTSKTPVLVWDIHSLLPITSYKIEYKKQEENDWQLLDEKSNLEHRELTISYTFNGVPNGTYDVKLTVTNRFGTNASTDSGAVVVDQFEPPNVIMSEKVSSGADSHFKISGLYIIMAVVIRLWSC